MKRSLIVSTLLLVLVSGGCDEKYSVRTTIHPNGSFEKVVVCEGDSLGIYRLPLPFTFKDGWKIDIRKDTAGRTTKFFATAVKAYADNEELQSELRKGRDSTKLAVSMQVEKRFRWFYTYYTYEEKIPAFGRFRQAIPFDSAFTQAEIERFRSGKDTLLNKRVDQYWTDNIVGQLIDEFQARAQSLNDPALAPERWKEKRNILAGQLIKNEVSKGEQITRLLERTFNAPSVRKLQSAFDTVENAFVAKAAAEKDLDVAYRNEVVMPGLLLSSNAESVEGPLLAWQCKPDRFLDVTMTARSRELNLWAVTVTAALCLALLAGLLIPVFRRA